MLWFGSYKGQPCMIFERLEVPLVRVIADAHAGGQYAPLDHRHIREVGVQILEAVGCA